MATRLLLSCVILFVGCSTKPNPNNNSSSGNDDKEPVSGKPGEKAGPKKEEAIRKDKAMLKGTWKVVEANFGGIKWPANSLAKQHMVSVRPIAWSIEGWPGGPTLNNGPGQEVDGPF